jgi:NADH-quinone oxidoreductase subunit C
VTPGEVAQRASAGLGPDAACETRHGEITVDVPPGGWLAALAFARDSLGCDFFDWLSAVDEEDQGLRVFAHVYSVAQRHHLLISTLVPRGGGLPTATGLYRGAAWHERETWEMFGLDFTGHPGLAPLLLPEGFEGHPLRKDFPLAARAAQDWPGLTEPGEQDTGRARRRLLPPGIPDGWEPP